MVARPKDRSFDLVRSGRKSQDGPHSSLVRIFVRNCWVQQNRNRHMSEFALVVNRAATRQFIVQFRHSVAARCDGKGLGLPLAMR